LKTPIFGPFYVSLSSNLAADRLLNLYPEIVETKQGKAVGALYSTPGLVLKATVGSGPIQGLHLFKNLLYVVSGNTLYSVSTGWAVTTVGSVAGAGPVSIIDNGVQMAVFNGNVGYLWDGSTLNPIALPFSAVGSIFATYQDGFGLINQPGSALWFQSDLLDLSSWNALNFGDASGDPDNLVRPVMIRREIWLIKQFETEIWYNAGTAGFAFARVDGLYIEHGIVAPESLVIDGEDLFWLSQSKSGQNVVVMSRGNDVVRISTHGIEAAINAYSTTTDAVGFSYQQNGHEFYVLNFPAGDATWVYDKTASHLSGTPMWHERAALANGALHRALPNTSALFNGFNVVGDYANGNLYAFDLGTYTDNGAAIKRLRAWRAVQQPTYQPQRFSQLSIDMETGITVAPDANPQMVLRSSDDGAHTWSTEHFVSAGKAGQTAARVQFNRLGSTRRNSGLDRIFELSTTDPFRVAIINADLT